MSWIFSQAMVNQCVNSTCSLALVEAFSEANCSDIDASVPSSGSHTPKPCLWHDKTMEPSRLSRFGQTRRILTDDLGADVLTWWLEGFPVRTSASQEKAQDSTANAAECGTTWRESLGKYDPDSHSLKTAQLSLIEDLTGCSVILPRWGCLLDGVLYPQPIAALHISANESGLWLTPKASDTGKGERQETFLARMGDRTDRCAQSLAAQVLNPKTWPTQTASDNRDRGNRSSPAIARRIAKGKQISLSATVSDMNGRLNPQWVEWLMGWPIGHTDLKPLETAKFRFARLWHLHSWQDVFNDIGIQEVVRKKQS